MHVYWPNADCHSECSPCFSETPIWGLPLQRGLNQAFSLLHHKEGTRMGCSSIWGINIFTLS